MVHRKAGQAAFEALGGIYRVFFKQIPLWLSLGLLFLWTALLLMPSFMSVEIPVSEPGEQIQSWHISLFFFVLSFFLIGFIARSFIFDFRAKRVLIPVCVAMALSTVFFCYFATAEVPYEAMLLTLGMFLVGALTPIPYIETVRQFTRSGFKMMLSCGAIATFFTCIGYLLLSLAPPQVRMIATILIPLGLCACLLFSSGSSKEDKAPLTPTPAAREHARVPYKLLMTSLVQGAAYGLGRLCLTRLDTFSESSYELSILFQLIGFVLAALTLVMLVAVFRFDFNILIYKIGFVLLGVGLLCITLEPLRYFGVLSFAAGYRFVDLLIFTLVVYLAAAKNLSLNWTASWPTCMLYVGFAVGYVLLGNLADTLNWLTLDKLVAVMALVVLLLAIIVVSERNVPGAWGYVELTDEESSSHPYREQVLGDISKRAELSGRQHEVFELIAKGKLRKEIAQELHLSEETVKVHIRGVYTKLGVHKKAEIFALIESEEQLLIE